MAGAIFCVAIRHQMSGCLRNRVVGSMCLPKIKQNGHDKTKGNQKHGRRREALASVFLEKRHQCKSHSNLIVTLELYYMGDAPYDIKNKPIHAHNILSGAIDVSSVGADVRHLNSAVISLGLLSHCVISPFGYPWWRVGKI